MGLHYDIKENAQELKGLIQKRWEEIVPIIEDNAELFGLLSGFKNKIELEVALVDKYMSSGEFDKAIANLGFAHRNYGSFFVIAQGEWQKAKRQKIEKDAEIPMIAGEKAEQFLRDNGLIP